MDPPETSADSRERKRIPPSRNGVVVVVVDVVVDGRRFAKNNVPRFRRREMASRWVRRRRRPHCHLGLTRN